MYCSVFKTKSGPSESMLFCQQSVSDKQSESVDKEENCLKRMFKYLGKTCGKYTH
jgi:hypothetical protein